MKKLIALVLAATMLFGLVACGTKNAGKTPATSDDTTAQTEKTPAAGDEATKEVKKEYTLKVAGIDGSTTLFPVYLAQEMGWFKEAGLTIERLGFTNGPVTMEAIDTWDISVTGIGGVLSGLISYDAVLLGKLQADDGTQYMFVRPDSAAAAAGTGHNSINDEIVGDAASWKKMSVNSTYGTVLHYLLLKTISGFGLNIDDITVNWMDMPTSNASFLAGEGDAACISGDMSLQPDKDGFLVGSTGPIAELGLQTDFVANPTAIADAELREAMKVFLKVFFKATDWITSNPNEATQYMIDWCEYAGRSISEEVALRNCTIDRYYTLEENYNALHASASDGGDYNSVQEEILGVLKFFIETESYQPGDDQLFLKEGHMDSSLIDELYAEAKE